MCGRFVRQGTAGELAREFGAARVLAAPAASYNVAPGQDVAVVMSLGGETVLAACRWGLTPGWEARDRRPMINARAETVGQKPSFKDAFLNRRCLVVAEGFYECLREGRTKRPFYIRLRSGRPFGMAGIYGPAQPAMEGGEDRCECAVITCASNPLVGRIHGRMPAIIHKSDEHKWLAGGGGASIGELLAPYEAVEMEGFEVSGAVNSAAFDSPLNISPRGERLGV